MKQFFFFASFVVMTMAAQAKIWRVNNNPGVVADATTAQAAHNLAAAGDTIHLEPSPTNYGSVTCTKPLVWLSIGGNLPANPGLQASTVQATIGSFTLNNGSSGSVVSVISSGACNISTDSITVQRSYFEDRINISGSRSKIVITQSNCTVISLENAQNAVVSNNIARGGVRNGTTGSAVIINNVLASESRFQNCVGILPDIYNSVFQNNIIVKGGTYNFFNSQASFNTTLDAGGLPAGNNNEFSAVMANIFVNPNGTLENDFMLKNGSPAIGTGFGGFDRGAFGGSTPFVLAFQPAIPAITTLSSPGASGVNSINVTFSAKSNQ